MNKKVIVLVIFTLALAVLYFYLKSQKSQEKSKEIIEQTTEKEPVVADSIIHKPEFRNIEIDEIDQNPLKLVPQEITLSDEETFTLDLPENFKIFPAAQGMPRVRFFAKSPDNRLFVTGMHALYDNEKGKVYILENFDNESKKFENVRVWKDKLRNPNSVQFYQDEAGNDWLYLALTDSLVRYPYTHGELKPSDEPEKIAEFPGYGLNYKYGGWHLTRTIAFHKHKLYVSVGSSCNLCEEKETEPSRAAIMQMNPDGSEVKVYAKGVRNAVDIGWVEGKFYATNMASDHLGREKPNDYFYEIREGQNYGWPYCFEHEGKFFEENPEHQSENRVAKKIVKNSWDRKNINCQNTPPAYALLEPHGSPLGFDYFDNQTVASALRNYFLIALHGSTVAKVGTGHRVVRLKKGHSSEPFIDGFLKNGKRVGRPCDIFQWDENSFFLSDDFAGVVYFVEQLPIQ